MEFVVSFLKAGGPIDYANSDGQTMLHAAAEGWQHQMINFLLIWGANVNGQDRFGNTPLHRLTLTREPPGPLTVAEPKESDLIKHRLLSFRSLFLGRPSLGLKDKRGGTALHLAAWEGDVVALDALLLGYNSSTIDEVSDKGATALLLAVLNNHVVCAKHLLNFGANIRFEISPGKTVLDRILETGAPEMKSLTGLAH